MAKTLNKTPVQAKTPERDITKEIHRVMTKGTPEQRAKLIHEMTKLVIEMNKDALKELEHY